MIDPRSLNFDFDQQLKDARERPGFARNVLDDIEILGEPQTARERALTALIRRASNLIRKGLRERVRDQNELARVKAELAETKAEVMRLRAIVQDLRANALFV